MCPIYVETPRFSTVSRDRCPPVNVKSPVAMAPSTGLSRLPHELQILLADFLPTDDLLSLCRTSRANYAAFIGLLQKRKDDPVERLRWESTLVDRKRYFLRAAAAFRRRLDKDITIEEVSQALDNIRAFGGSKSYRNELHHTLITAIRILRNDLVRMCLDRGVDVNRKLWGYTALHFASRVPSLNKPFPHYHRELPLSPVRLPDLTPQAEAATEEQFQIIDWLLEAGCNVNVQSRRGETPVMIAASCAQLDIIEHLVSRGAWLTNCTKKGETALTLACRRFFLPLEPRGQYQTLVREKERNATVEYLLKNTGKVLLNYPRATPLHIAVRNKFMWIVGALIRAGADVNSVNDGVTPFMEAVLNADEELIVMLLRIAGSKIDFEQRSMRGMTVLELAVMTKQRQVADLIRDVWEKQKAGKGNGAVGGGKESPPSSVKRLRKVPSGVFFGS